MSHEVSGFKATNGGLGPQRARNRPTPRLRGVFGGGNQPLTASLSTG